MYYRNLREKILGEVNRLRRVYAKRFTLPGIVSERHAPDLELDANECRAAKEHAKWLALQHRQFNSAKRQKLEGESGRLSGPQSLEGLGNSWLVESPRRMRPDWHEMVAYRETGNKPHEEFLSLVRGFFNNDAIGTRGRFLLAAEGKMAVGFGLRRLGGKKTALYLCLRLKRRRNR